MESRTWQAFGLFPSPPSQCFCSNVLYFLVFYCIYCICGRNYDYIRAIATSYWFGKKYICVDHSVMSMQQTFQVRNLANLLRKNVVDFFLGNQISFEKRAIFDLLFTFFSHQGKVTQIPTSHISFTYIHVFCSPYWLFLPYQFWKKCKFIRYMGSFWYESWCVFLFAPFWNNQ